MGKLSMCRICVAENVRMHVVTDGKLHDVYERLTDVPFMSEDKRPMVACFVCYVKLKQCYRLLRQCMQAEEMFRRMLCEDSESNLMAKEEEIVFPKLSITAVMHMDIEDNIYQVDSASINVECVKVERVVCETHEEEASTEYINATTSVLPSGDNQNPEYLLPYHTEDCSLDDDTPLMFFKSEEEGVEDVNKMKRKLETGGTPAANRPKLDTQGATLQDTITDKQTKHGKTEPETHHTNKNSASKSVTELNESVISIEFIKQECDDSHIDEGQEPINEDANKDIIVEINTAVDYNRCNNSSKSKKRMGRTYNNSNTMVPPNLTHADKKTHECDICHRSFKSRAQMNKHIRIHSVEKPYKCGICERDFHTNSNLKAHIRTHSGEKPHKCEICERSFTVLDSLNRHIRTHTGEKPFKCEICQRSFTVLDSLNRHIRTHTGEKPFKCEICQRGFNSKSHMHIHIRTHAVEKPYKCEICQRDFNTNSNLKVHMRTHTGEKPYKCETCQRGFTEHGNLMRHIRTHTGEKPFKCETCERSFSDYGILNRHIRTHTGEKPYKCQICLRGFINSTNLKNHIRTHTGEKPYKCQICQRGFTEHGILKRHMRTHRVDKT